MRKYTSIDTGEDGEMLNGIELYKMTSLTPHPAYMGTFTVVLLMNVGSLVTWHLLSTQTMSPNLGGVIKAELMTPHKGILSTCLWKN